MTHVRLFKPAKTAMQSGRAKTKQWLMVFDDAFSKDTDPVMGWVQGSSPKDQLRLSFDSLEAAIHYAQEKKYVWEIAPSHTKDLKPKLYGDNFTNPRYRR